MQVKANLNNLKTSVKKAKLIIDLIRKSGVDRAQRQLSFLNKKAAKDILKLLNSAIANAENNFNLQKSNLFVKSIVANEGPSLKRWRPRAFGRASGIQKRTCYINLILDELVPTVNVKVKKDVIDQAVVVSADEVQDSKPKVDKVIRSRSSVKAKTQVDNKSGFTKKVFQRKAG